MTALVEFEVDLLRSMNGEETSIKGWSGAVGVAIECLLGRKLVSREHRDDGIHYVINDAGRAYLAQLKPKGE